MKEPTKPKKLVLLLAGAALCGTQNFVLAKEVGPECRGVAAGVVAAMRAAGEIVNPAAAEAAVTAARRACTAALEGDLGVQAASETSAEGSAEKTTVASEETSVWDLLSKDRKSKPGHDRLRRLKTQ